MAEKRKGIFLDRENLKKKFDKIKRKIRNDQEDQMGREVRVSDQDVVDILMRHFLDNPPEKLPVLVRK